MNVFLALDIHTFSQMALGQNLIWYMLVSSIERITKPVREEFFCALGILLCPIAEMCKILFCTKLTSE